MAGGGAFLKGRNRGTGIRGLLVRHNRKRKRMSEGGEVERVREKTDYSGPTIDGRAKNPIRAQRPWPDSIRLAQSGRIMYDRR